MALGVDGLRVGTWTSPAGTTGCTVLLPPAGTLGALAVRGSAPGTREAAALGISGKLTVCHAVVLSGGSAYGLATADGVMRWCEEQGIGYETRLARVPIVGAAIVLDDGVADPAARPDADAGYAACAAATDAEPAEGSVGAGRGTTIAKVAGPGHAWRGGQGVAVRRHGDLVVGALVVNNAVGELRADDGRWLGRARVPEDAERYPYTRRWLEAEAASLAEPEAAGPTDAGPTDTGPSDAGPTDAVPTDAAGPTDNTVIGCVVTNARLDKRAAHRVADLGHTGIARAVWPAHTEFDGDALFCLATGRVDADLDLVATLAADAVADAARRGPLAATAHGGVPALAAGSATAP